jgi:uncharacterized protein DUF5681
MTNRSRNNATKTRGRGPGRPFQPGNPGRPKGARHRATLAAEVLLDGEAEALSRKAVEMALAGDTTALRLCLDRILPPRRERPVNFTLPSLQKPADAIHAMAAITGAVSMAEITPSEAAELAKLVGAFVQTLEANDLDQRLRTIEAWKDRGDGRGGREN